MERRAARGWLIALGVAALAGGLVGEIGVACAGVFTAMVSADFGSAFLREVGASPEALDAWLDALEPRLWPHFSAPTWMCKLLYVIGVTDIALGLIAARSGGPWRVRAARWLVGALGLVAIGVGVVMGRVVERAREGGSETLRAAAVDLVGTNVPSDDRAARADEWMITVSPHLRRVFLPARAVPWMFFTIGGAQLLLARRMGKAPMMMAVDDRAEAVS